MQKKIVIGGQEINYFLRRSRRSRSLRLSINSTAVITISAPKYLPLYFLERFIISKADWVLEKIECFKNNPTPPRLSGSAKNFALRKKDAHRLVKEKITEFNQIYNFSYQKFIIRNQKSRWGSCSSRGILNFNYKLVFLPEHLTDYLIVHELCHLKEMNHSRRFWNEVARSIPDYQSRRRALKIFKFADCEATV